MSYSYAIQEMVASLCCAQGLTAISKMDHRLIRSKGMQIQHLQQGLIATLYGVADFATTSLSDASLTSWSTYLMHAQMVIIDESIMNMASAENYSLSTQESK